MRALAADKLRDIKPPLSFPGNYFWLIIIGIVLIAASALALAVYLFKKRKSLPSQVVLPPKLPHVVALEALGALRQRNFPQQGKIEEYYVELSSIVRQYLERRFMIRAPEMTTEEFLYFLRDSDKLEQVHKELLRSFLYHCDLVKFARYGPSLHEIEDSFLSAKRLVEETKDTQEPQVLTYHGI
jgi:hypothetical protein